MQTSHRMTITSDFRDFFVGKLPRVVMGARRLYGSFSWRRKSPVERLPNELLSSILFTTIQDYPYDYASVLKLTHVCARWRHIVLGTGKFWASILVTSPNSSRQLSRIAIWLSRSRKYPLDFLLDFRDPSWNWDEDNHRFGWQDMEHISRILVVQVQRWRNLQLLTDTWAPIFTFLWYTRHIDSAPELESLALSRCNAYFACKGERFKPTALRQPIALFGGLPLDKLRKVSLVGVHVDWINTPFHNLSELEFKFHASDVMPSLQDFSRILLDSPGLHRLVIMGWGPRFDVSRNSRNPIQEKIMKQKRSIVLPQLENLTLGFLDTKYAADLLCLFFLPSLKGIALEDITATTNPGDILDSTPFLDLFTPSEYSDFYSSSTGTSPCFIPGNISALRLNSIHCSAVTLINFFQQFAGLKSLHITRTGDEALKALGSPHFTAQLSAETPSIPCSRLTELHCQDMDPELLIDTVRIRANSKSVLPLETVSLEHQGRNMKISNAEIRGHLIKGGVKDVRISPIESLEDRRLLSP